MAIITITTRFFIFVLSCDFAKGEPCWLRISKLLFNLKSVLGWLHSVLPYKDTFNVDGWLKIINIVVINYKLHILECTYFQSNLKTWCGLLYLVSIFSFIITWSVSSVTWTPIIFYIRHSFILVHAYFRTATRFSIFSSTTVSLMLYVLCVMA